jgi:uncharacterized protein YndB with AHSA1/START domain
MVHTAHVYQIYIAATPEAVFRAITDSDWTRKYFHHTSFVAPPVAGAGYRTVTPDGRDAVEGVIEELMPPSDGQPGRLVQTWHVLYDAALSAEPPSRVEWTVEGVGPDLTRVRLVHGGLAFSPLTWAHVKDGWVWIIDALKTLLETGRPLANPEVEPAVSETPEGDWHRRQGVEANNAVHGFLERDRTPEEDEDLLRHAYAAAYHWERATGAKPENEARASYMIARALVATGQAERGLVSADRVLAVCEEHGLADFDLAYAHEARSRALSALGRTEEAVREAASARSVPIADLDDLATLDADLADLPTV